MASEMPLPIDDQELMRRRRAKNWALLAVLVALVLVFYVVTIVRVGAGAHH